MERTIINEQTYRQRVFGGWLGKNIGGTLGEPVEGEKERLNLSFYPDLPAEGGPLANDDLDLQLVSLHALEQYGVRLTAAELAQKWLDHVTFPYREYGYCLGNLRRGLVPPVAGWFNNQFYNDCMGAPIRSEIWAMVAPGAPDVAATYAYQDAVVDHAEGEGGFGEMFNAAVESAAFFEDDPHRLIEIGLEYIPSDSEVSAAVQSSIGTKRDTRGRRHENAFLNRTVTSR